MRWPAIYIASLMLVLPGGAPLQAAEVTAAVATNFLETLQRIEPLWESATGHDLVISAGSTGSLYAQIANGAPYDVFLSADEERPARAIAEGRAVAESRFVYAVGTLVLYSPDPERVRGPDVLDGDFRHLAIANPRTAPYGAAARQVLTALGYWERLQGRIAQAQSVAGAWSAVAAGAADLGFVALSSVQAHGSSGSYWTPPQALYTPLRQSAVLLERARDDPAARSFLDFLRSEEVLAVIRGSGYTTP